MAEAIPQLDSAADAADTDFAHSESGDLGATERAAAAPDGQPRTRKTPEEIIKGLQSENDRMKGKFGKLLGSRWAKELGGDGILELIDQSVALIAHPEIKAQLERGALMKGLDGQWKYQPTSTQKAAAVDAQSGFGAETGEYEDPTVKALKTYLDERLSPVVEQLQSLRMRSETALNAGGQQKIAEFTRRFLADYPLAPEEREKFAESLSGDIANLDATMLLKMDYDQFSKRVALPNAIDFLPAALARKAQQKGTRLAALATDAATPGSQGADTAQAKRPVKSWNALQKELAAAAERAARETA